MTDDRYKDIPSLDPMVQYLALTIEGMPARVTEGPFGGTFLVDWNSAQKIAKDSAVVLREYPMPVGELRGFLTHVIEGHEAITAEGYLGGVYLIDRQYAVAIADAVVDVMDRLATGGSK